MHEGDGKHMDILTGRPEGRQPSYRWDDDIKMDLK
jgi:hypothetical protein